MPRPYLANLPLLQSFHQRTQLNSIIKVGFEVIHCVATAVELQVDPVHEGVLLNGNPLVTVSASHRQPPPFLRSGLLADEVHFSRHVCLCLCVSPTPLHLLRCTNHTHTHLTTVLRRGWVQVCRL